MFFFFLRYAFLCCRSSPVRSFTGRGSNLIDMHIHIYMCVRALSRSSCSVSCPSLHGGHLDVRARHRVNIIPGMQKYLAVVLIRGSHSRCLGLDGCLWNGDPSRPRAAKSSFSVPGLCGVSWDLIECCNAYYSDYK